MGLFDKLLNKKENELLHFPLSYRMEDLISMNIGSGFRILPYDMSDFFERIVGDTQSLKIFIDAEITNYLPNIAIINGITHEVFFKSLCHKSENGISISYTIRMGLGLVGMIFLNTPAYNLKMINLNKWTVDFFLLSPFRGRGIMKSALIRILYILKEKIGTNEVYAIVDKKNSNCIKTLENSMFKKLSLQDKDNTAYTFRCDLSTINFE